VTLTAQEVAAAAGEKLPVRQSAASELVVLASDLFRVGMSTDETPYAVLKDGAQVARELRGTASSLRAKLSQEYWTTHKKVAPAQALSEALVTLDGECLEAKTRERLYLRVAECDGALWLDLGDESGRAVKITAHGWSVEDGAPILFRRTALTSALPEPIRGGDLDELWSLLNVSKRSRSIVLASLVSSLYPDMPHVVLIISGEQGSAKTTAAKILAGLVDPSPAQVRKAPRDADGWMTSASGSWVVALDNVSGIPEWLSDAICRAVTGDADVQRLLYTNSEMHLVSFRRVVILNGIDFGTVRPDLADRLAAVELDRIEESDRLRDGVVADRWKDAHPRILGALLDLAVEVMATLPGVDLDRVPRMADFSYVLAAIDTINGTDGLGDYRTGLQNLAAEAMDSDPILTSLDRMISLSWDGTARKLLADLEAWSKGDDQYWRPGRDWPKSARALTATMRRQAPSLRKLGWEVEVSADRHDHAKSITYHLARPTEGGCWDDPQDLRQECGKSAARVRQGAANRGMDAVAADFAAAGVAPLACDDTHDAMIARQRGNEPPISLLDAREVERERDAPQRRPVSVAALPRCRVALADDGKGNDEMPDLAINGWDQA
jgi:hypothetical protein